MSLESRYLPSVAVYPDAPRNALQSIYVAQANQAKNPVVFLGDSLTLNWGTSRNSAYGSAAFTADFAPLGAANFGVGGDKTVNLLGRIEGGDLNGKPKVAVVMIGLNDLLTGSTAAQTAFGVAAVVQAIQAESPATRILLLGVLPTKVPSLNLKVQQLDAIISGLGSVPGVTYLDPGAFLRGPDGNARPNLLYDSIHLNAAGYKNLAMLIDGTVVKLLQAGGHTLPLSPSSSTAAGTTPTSASQNGALIPLIVAPDSTSEFPTIVKLLESTSASRTKSHPTMLINVLSS
jgi:N-acetylglucosamine-6-sulfatase